jgi:Rrf2 family protein
MQLKNQVEWALHCCAILANVPPDRYLPTKALAELHGVPKEYLSKALQGLSQANIVESTLGPTGGYRLARLPDQITFLDVVEAVEGKSSTFECTEIRKNNPCRTPSATMAKCDAKPCAIARVMWQADHAWRAKLKSVRMSDLVETLEQDLPPALWKMTGKWVAERA